MVLQMAILDGKEYASLQDGRDNTEEEVTKCILLTNNQVCLLTLSKAPMQSLQASTCQISAFQP